MSREKIDNVAAVAAVLTPEQRQELLEMAKLRQARVSAARCSCASRRTARDRSRCASGSTGWRAALADGLVALAENAGRVLSRGQRAQRDQQIQISPKALLARK